MTREQKVALILGFALVLVVGVLVSDHLSGAREATLVDIELPETEDRPVFRTYDEEPQFAQAPAINDQPAGFLDHIEDEPVETYTAPVETPALAMGDPVEEDTMLETIRDSVRDAMHELRNGNGPSPAFQTETRTITMGEPVGRSRETVAPAGSGDVRVHVVRKGETLWAIAERYYGTGFVHADLLRYNAGRIRNAGELNPGLNLLIPDRRDLGSAPPATVATRPATTPARTQATPATTRTYTVAKGDTLSEISQKQLGTSKRWEEIMELNADKIDEPTDLYVGLKLKLPAR
ncbi:unnamed protein product [Symbiodinium necroappetens]|uniref:LysM domain-containing protein n=1 Tax=Symbiodinium necroappetens TaxID=1628268 RepID=A0A812INP5_9DINO|nr:unnamed protein product [Symbiodinium necroappetens]